MNVYCDNEKCTKDGDIMTITEQEDNQEKHRIVYECDECGQMKEHLREFDQRGLTITDEVNDIDN